jgi:hypothetical protein
MHLSFEMIWIGLKLGSEDSLLARVCYSIELSHEALHDRSQLFMIMLTGQSCWALVVQVLLVNYFGCRDAWVLRVLWQVRVAQWRLVWGLGSQLRARALKSCWALHILGLDASPYIIECQSFVMLPLCFNTSNTSWSMYSDVIQELM